MAEGSDNLGKAGAESLVTETAMRERFSEYHLPSLMIGIDQRIIAEL